MEAGGEAHCEDMVEGPAAEAGRKLFGLAAGKADSTTGQAGFTG